MISKNQEARRAEIERTLFNLLYRKHHLEKELEAVEKDINHIEGAIKENEAVKRDILNAAALENAKPQTTEGS